MRDMQQVVEILRLATSLQESWNGGEFSIKRDEWGHVDPWHWYRASYEYKRLWLLVHGGVIDDFRSSGSNDGTHVQVRILWNDNEVGRIGRLLTN